MIGAAFDLAVVHHRGQVDKAGRDYLHAHVADVVRRLALAGERDPEAYAVAWLHDVVEDTPVTIDDLRAHGLPEAVIEAVDAISHRLGEPRRDYYARVRANPLALRVKLADLDSNTDPGRLALLDGETRARLAIKYAIAREALA